RWRGGGGGGGGAGGGGGGRRGGQGQRAADAVGLAVDEPGVRAHEQPVGSDAHAGRLGGRRRGGAGRGPHAARVRQRHRRFDPRARRVLRRVRAPAERDGDAAQRTVSDAADAERRSGDGRAGADGALGGGPRAGGGRRGRRRGRRGRRVAAHAAGGAS